MWTKGQLRLGCGHSSVPADCVQEGVQITGPWRGRRGQTPPPPLQGMMAQGSSGHRDFGRSQCQLSLRKAVFLSEGPSIVGVSGQGFPILQMGKLRREKIGPLSWSRHSPAARPGSGLECASVPSCPALETLGVVGLCGGVGGLRMPARVPRGALRVGDHVRGVGGAEGRNVGRDVGPNHFWELKAAGLLT